MLMHYHMCLFIVLFMYIYERYLKGTSRAPEIHQRIIQHLL